MEVSDHLHSPAALTLEKEPPAPIQDEAGKGRAGHQGQSGRLGEEKKKPSNLLEIEPQIA
jgi:hypothetical protein